MGHQKLPIADKSAEIETGPRCENEKKELGLAREAILGYTNRPVTDTILCITLLNEKYRNILDQAVYSYIDVQHLDAFELTTANINNCI